MTTQRQTESSQVQSIVLAGKSLSNDGAAPSKTFNSTGMMQQETIQVTFKNIA
jgi:hypothetical protein